MSFVPPKYGLPCFSSIIISLIDFVSIILKTFNNIRPYLSNSRHSIFTNPEGCLFNNSVNLSFDLWANSFSNSLFSCFKEG